jgi:hypothetical protein
VVATVAPKSVTVAPKSVTVAPKPASVAPKAATVPKPSTVATVAPKPAVSTLNNAIKKYLPDNELEED